MLEKRGRTAYWLAKETGIRYASIWQMTRGDTARLHIETLDRICGALECQPGDLLVRVERSVQVKVAYSDEKSAPQMIEAEGALAELLQHEIDHLDGILAVARALSPQAFSTRAEWERQLKG